MSNSFEGRTKMKSLFLTFPTFLESHSISGGEIEISQISMLKNWVNGPWMHEAEKCLSNKFLFRIVKSNPFLINVAPTANPICWSSKLLSSYSPPADQETHPIFDGMKSKLFFCGQTACWGKQRKNAGERTFSLLRRVYHKSNTPLLLQTLDEGKISLDFVAS